MEFSLSKMLKREDPSRKNKVDILDLMAAFREEVKSLKIEGVDVAHLIGEDMEMWKRRRVASERELQEYEASIRGDRMSFGPSRFNFYKYLRQHKNRFN
ncbi:hypothetical protein K8Q98_00480 [Candidatus Nomurabacteria bacterium]|nr:hypothetical protein [Candidatus Nomurabacteria bacterium]